MPTKAPLMLLCVLAFGGPFTSIDSTQATNDRCQLLELKKRGAANPRLHLATQVCA